MKQIVFLLAIISISFSGFSQNEFGFQLFSELENEENMLFSPTSIKTAFSMVYEGANGETLAELEKVFGFEEDNSEFFEDLKKLKEVAGVSNSIWILDKFKVLDSYTESIKSNFDASPNFTDFKNDPKGSADKINKWIEESTNGMIKEMLTPADVQDFKLALVNAIYFKKGWEKPFNEDRTKKSEFTNFEGEKEEVEMMRNTTYFPLYQGSKEQVIELPYSDKRTSMVIIMPKNMKSYELSNNSYNDLISNLNSQKVDLQLPKFTFEMPTFELRNSLLKMGVRQAFSDAADLSGIRKEKDLKVGTVLHKAKIIVNEVGTEAAAATVIGVVSTTSVSQPVPIINLIIDKPFYYFIRDKESGTILFMGKTNSIE